MATKTIHVTLAPNHEALLTSDAPDIGALVREIVNVRDAFDPEQVKVSCDYEGFDKVSFREIVIQAANDFIEAIRLDEEAFENALKDLKDCRAGSKVAK